MNLDASAFVADQELVQALTARAVPVDTATDRPLFHQGDAPTGLYILHGGEVLMSLHDQRGREVVSIPAQPDSLLGLPAVVGNTGYSLSAIAHKGASVSFLGKDEFSEMMMTHPQVGLMILRVLAAEVRTARMALSGR